jgi:hypothetical protein
MPITTTEFRLGVDGVATVELSDGSTKTVDLANISGGGGSVDVTAMSAALNATDIAGRAAFREAGRVSTFAGTVADTNALVAISNPLRLGDVVQVGSGVSANDYRLIALPTSVLGNWRNLGVSAGSGATNLTLTQTASDVTVVSDTGTDAIIPAATSTNAGVMSSAQVTALAGKQDAIALGTNKLLLAPTTLGGAPGQITLGTNLSLSGSTLNATGSGSTPIVNDLTTGGTTSALSAEMGKVLQTTKAAAINASPIVGAGVTSLTRTAVTTVGAEAPTGYYNRPLISDHSVTVDVTGAVAGDALMVLNSAGSNITLTASSTVVTIAPGKTGEVVYNGTSWVDPAVTGGTSYTDAQALAASVLSGALGTDTTKAPTHSAVTTAISAASVGGGNISTIAPTTFSTVPVSTTRGVLASVTVPAGTLGARGILKALAEFIKSGTTDAGSWSIRVGAIGGNSTSAIEVLLLNTTAANTVASVEVHVRANGTNLIVLKNTPSPWGPLTSATTVAVDQSSGFVVYFCATTSTTDTAALIGAHVEYSKVI